MSISMDRIKKMGQLLEHCMFINTLLFIISEAVSISSTCRDDTDCGFNFCDLTTNRCMDCERVCVNRFDRVYCKRYCPDMYEKVMSSTTRHTSLLNTTTIIGPTPAHVIHESSIPTAILIIGLLLLVAVVLVVGTILFMQRGRFVGNGSTTASTISLEQSIYTRQIPSTITTIPLLEHSSVDSPYTSQVTQPFPGFPIQATEKDRPDKDMLVPSRGQDLDPGMKLFNPEDPLKNRCAENDR